jgi:hypothetical protein
MSHLNRRFPRYSRLLNLYPPAYRQSYSEQMLQTLADMLDDKDNNRSTIWGRAALDFPFSLAKQNILTMGDIMTHETPDYVKRSSLVSALLLAPFFTFLTLDSITSHSLYGSWLWHPWVIAAWIIFMPALAFLLSASAFLRWLIERQHQKRVSFWHNLLDWRRNWPMATIIVISLGIIALVFFHDSVHCITNNPIPELRHWHITLRCIQNG